MLLTSVVVLEVPGDLPRPLVQSALRSCNLALGAGQCILDGDPRRTVEKPWVAVLSLSEDSRNAVHIELHQGTESFPVVSMRTLEFQETDLPEHRWATAGVVTAALVVSAETTLVSDRQGQRPEPAPPRQRPRAPNEGRQRRPSPPESPPASAKRPAASALRLDLAFLAGPGFDQGPWRIGGQLRTSLALGGPPAVFWASVAAARRDGGVDATWGSGHAGLGICLRTVLPLVDLEGRVGGAASRVAVSTTEGELRAQKASWRLGAVGALDVVVRASEQVHTVVSGETTATWPRIDVKNHDALVGRDPTLGWAALIGLRWIAWQGEGGG